MNAVMTLQSALRVLAAWLALIAAPVTFAGAVEYPAVAPGYVLEFPRDEGSHPEFRTEWWYVTGWLEDESGAPLGFQVTFFRARPGVDEDNPSRFAARQALFAHVAVSDPRLGKLLHDERSARAGFGLAEAQAGSLDVVIDDWFLRAQPAGARRYETAIEANEFAMQLQFVATQPPLLQGQDGYSQKGPNPVSASYYYSLPHLQASGRVRIGKQHYKVRGTAWMDHEWSSEYLEPQARGWDWAGVNLDDGGALMVFRMRGTDGKPRWQSATWRRAPDAPAAVFSGDAVQWFEVRRWRSPRTGTEYPVEWRVSVGERTLTLRPLLDDQENDARGSTGTIYWEGAVRASDESGRPVGRGYLELTGYKEKVRM